MISWASFLTVAGMLAVTYFTRLAGFLALRNRTLGKRAAAVMEAAPGCVLVAVITPYFVSGKPHELLALGITLFAAARWGMMATVLIAVASSGILGYLMK